MSPSTRPPTQPEPDFEEAVLQVIRAIPRGEVMTYGEVAEAAGRPGAARAVGNLLRLTAEDLPWWRVVRADGRLAAPDSGEQAARLRAEGIGVVGDRMNRWKRRRERRAGMGRA